MATIDIDFDVEKALFNLRSKEEVTYNDVLRDLLGLGPKKNTVSLSNGDWVVKGVCFPINTKFRATYKGQTYYGKVEAGGLVVDDKRFTSPSLAAVEITGYPVNGWMFWECRLPGSSSWQMIKFLRK